MIIENWVFNELLQSLYSVILFRILKDISSIKEKCVGTCENHGVTI